MSTTVKIIETSEIKELTLSSPKTNLDYSSDFLGMYDAYDGIEKNEETGEQTPTMTQETYNWWETLLEEYENADFKSDEYCESLAEEEKDKFLEILNDSTGCDLEDIPDAMISAIELHKESLKGE